MEVHWNNRFEFSIELSEEEATKELFPAIFSVFHKNMLSCWENLPLKPETVFQDPTWRTVVLPGNLTNCYERDEAITKSMGDVFTDTASDEELDDVHFWAIQYDALQPLFEMLVERRDWEIYSIPCSGIDLDVGGAITLPSRRLVSGAYLSGIVEHSYLLTSKSRDWGLFSPASDASLLGGNAPFLDDFLGRSGGIDALKRKTDAAYLEHRWSEAVWENLYKVSGWSFPENEN